MSLGRWIFKAPKPACCRPLFPLLLYGDKRDAAPWVIYGEGRWVAYQLLRFAFFWAALYAMAVYWGPWPCVLTAALAGLTLRFDYWSNAVELFAAALVLAAPGGLAVALLAGLVLGLGRETLPFLGLLCTPFAVVFAIGATISQIVVRAVSRPDPQTKRLAESLKYGWAGGENMDWNIRVLFGGGAVNRFGAAVYCGLAMLGVATVPMVAIPLVAATLFLARINEPRILTMLIPFVAVRLA